MTPLAAGAKPTSPTWRRLAADGAVHLYACRQDAAALPAALHYHRLRAARTAFLRPAVRRCLAELSRITTMSASGDDKTRARALYPQGGLCGVGRSQPGQARFDGDTNFASRQKGPARSFARLSDASTGLHRR